jgi:hypothetical protein
MICGSMLKVLERKERTGGWWLAKYLPRPQLVEGHQTTNILSIKHSEKPLGALKVLPFRK